MLVMLVLVVLGAGVAPASNYGCQRAQTEIKR